MKTRKFVMYGPYRAGKETFLSTLVPEFYPQKSYEATVDEGAQTSLTFGKMPIGDDLYYFYSLATHKRFDFMWEILSEDSSGYMFIVDSVYTETFLELRRAIPLILGFRYAPYIVIANHQDHPDAYPLELLHNALDLDDSVPVVSCVAHDKTSVQATFDILLKRMTQRQPPHNMKFLIYGPDQAGKTTFIKSLVDVFEPQIVERRRKREDDLIADFGTLRINDHTHSFHAVSTAWRNNAVPQTLAAYCDGFLLIVDSTRAESFPQLRDDIHHLLAHRPGPAIVIANKQDHPNALSPEMIRPLLGIDASIPIVPSVAHDKILVRAAFEVLLKHIAP